MENPLAAPPEELSDQALAGYLTQAGTHYGNAANDYLSKADTRRAYKYFRKAAQNLDRAAELSIDAEGLFERARQNAERAAIVRHIVARNVVSRRRWRLRLWSRPR